MNTNQQYLETFFEEKDLPYTSWNIQDLDGTMHLIDSDVAIEYMVSNPKIADMASVMIRKIDFANGDVMDFLKYIADYIVKMEV